ncbi:MAG: helix-turn-helix transcriptional regulator, partial [Planctomycetes bacterium]|nr:helix-turn-helix transcriptional regulator [Planctomycetota bacterium]
GKRYVLVPETEYRRLSDLADAGEPELPTPDAEGCYPAIETVRVLIAQDIIRARRRLGLTQAELAERAGVRVETISRLEHAKHSPSIRTVDKIDRALKAAGAEHGKGRRKRVESV